jgi:2-aminoadipate transaminase
MEPDGMNLEKLEEALSTYKKIRLLYTIPNFQNPTGFTTSAAKRKRIYELARKHDVMIFEDNPYGELRFAGDPIPSIKTLDTDGRVIYAGSFSKVMAPAFRLGMVVFNKTLSDRMSVAKQCADVHSNVLFQHICWKYMTGCDYAGHIAEIRNLYRRKANLMLSAMEQHFHPDVRFNRPQGGLFVMAFLSEGTDSYPFVAEGIERGVACVPGVAFAVDQSKPNNGFRMNYSTPSDDQIQRGVEILGELTRTWAAR